MCMRLYLSVCVHVPVLSYLCKQMRNYFYQFNLHFNSTPPSPETSSLTSLFRQQLHHPLNSLPTFSNPPLPPPYHLFPLIPFFHLTYSFHCFKYSPIQTTIFKHTNQTSSPIIRFISSPTSSSPTPHFIQHPSSPTILSICPLILSFSPSSHLPPIHHSINNNHPIFTHHTIHTHHQLIFHPLPSPPTFASDS